jgi:dihydroflavonol-4-reductase
VGFLKHIAKEAMAEERLSLVAAELLTPGSFDGAVQGCDYVLHTASPFFLEQNGDPDEVFIRPAVQGTENVLNAVAKAGSVKRVVLTSSCAAVYGYNADKDGAYTEEDWNRTSTRQV